MGRAEKGYEAGRRVDDVTEDERDNEADNWEEEGSGGKEVCDPGP